FWSTAMAKTINEEAQIHARVDGKEIIITESSVRRDLRLADEEGTTSDGSPMCQEAMGDTIAQTRFENVSKLSNNLLVARGNTVQSDEDRMKLDQLMELCTNLQSRVIDLEKTKTTQVLEITSLKRRVKKLEKKQSSRTHKLKRLYKERKIHDIDADEDISLVNDQDDAEMVYVNDLHGEDVFVEKKLLIKRLVLLIDADYQLAQRLQTKEQEELTIKEKATLIKKLLEKRRKHFTAKTAEEKRNKPPTQALQRKIMCTYLKNVEGKKLTHFKNKSFDSIQTMFDRAFNRVNTFVDFKTELVEGSSKRAREELTQERFKKQKLDDDKETIKLKELIEIISDKEEVPINVIPLAVKSPKIVGWMIHKEGKKSYYQIIRDDGISKMYMVFN
nr:hypothetical protein [Tanacetum cinerariifolium]